jgi:hypothetical protein
MQSDRQQHAEHEGDDDSRYGDGQCARADATESVGVEFQPDREHVENDA